MNFRTIISSLFCLVLFTISIHAANTGKIRGKVTNKITGDPIVNANIKGVGQDWGAASDLRGEFVILNIQPGIYAVEISSLGYHTITIRDVYVASDLTTELTVELTPSELVLEEVEIIYEKPDVVLDPSSSTARMSSERSESVRPDNATETAKMTTGFKLEQEGKMHIRGLRAGEVNKIVKGGETALVPPEPPEPLEQKVEIEVEDKTFEGETYEKPPENLFDLVVDKPLSTFSIDVDKASYANTRRYLNSNMLPPIEAVRVEEFINYFDYDYPKPKGEHPIEIITEVAECP